MIVFVVHKEFPGASGGSQARPWGSSGTSPGGLTDVPGESQGRALGFQGRPRGSQGTCPGDPRDASGLQGRPGHPRDSFRMYDSLI